MTPDPLAVLLVSRRDRDLVPRVPGLDALDEDLAEARVWLLFGKRFFKVVHDPPCPVDPVLDRGELVCVKEGAEHEHRRRPARLGPGLLGAVERLLQALSRSPQDVQRLLDARARSPGRAPSLRSSRSHYRMFEPDTVGFDFDPGVPKARADPLVSREPENPAHLGRLYALRGYCKALKEVETPPAAEHLGASGEFGIGVGHSVSSCCGECIDESW